MKLSSQLSNPLTHSSCEFCSELTEDPNSRFKRLYSTQLPSRVIKRSNGFVVLPTLGQLFKGSLLILPEEHVETFSSLSTEMLARLPDLLNKLEVSTTRLGMPLIFEHGAKCFTGSGCGIYHAHLHLVPVPRSVHYSALIPTKAQGATGLCTALLKLRSSNQYLLVRDTDGNTVFAELDAFQTLDFPSQYVRRKLVEYFNLSTSWDWRDYTQPEPWLTETVQMFETHVPIC
jgi:diadenosine tetraphosphate (Ap4A) HIT family hydrolase